MKTEKNIFIAFVLNLVFSIFEFVGGIFTGSVAIISDAVHDLGDAVSCGLSFFLEKISKKQPDEVYTYGYLRFSVLGGIITTLILIFGSAVVIYSSVLRFINPSAVDYDGMIIFALFGALVNFLAAFITRGGDSINQRAVNLHMLEDVFGWIVVLIGATVIKFTEVYIIDPLMSLGVAVFILISALKNLRVALELFVEKLPRGINVNEIREHIMEIEGVLDVHHIHIRSIDGQNNYATMHVALNKYGGDVKQQIREELREHGIGHATIETELPGDVCHERICRIDTSSVTNSHHHHHHH